MGSCNSTHGSVADPYVEVPLEPRDDLMIVPHADLEAHLLQNVSMVRNAINQDDTYPQSSSISRVQAQRAGLDSILD